MIEPPAQSSSPAEPAEKPLEHKSLWVRFKGAVGRLTLAHFIAYPVGFIAAVGAIPLTFWVRGDAILQAEPGQELPAWLIPVAQNMVLDEYQATQLRLVMEWVMGCALLTWVWVHLLALPWVWVSMQAQPTPQKTSWPKAARLFMFGVFGTILVWVLLGAVGWVWLFTL